MYFNSPILSKKKDKYELMKEACEASSVGRIKHKYKEEYTILEKYYPYIESFLPKTEHILFRHIAKYEDSHADLLNSPYPLDVIVFKEDGDDGNIIYKCVHINKSEIDADVKKVSVKINEGVEEKASFQSLQIIMLLMIRYYLITKQKDKLYAIYYYYGYSIYWKRFNKQLKKYGYKPKEEIMIYTINDLSYKYIIKQLGSVKEWLRYMVQSSIENYPDEMADLCDEDISYILGQVWTDVRNKVVRVAEKYYENFSKKNEIRKSTGALDDEGTQRIDTSLTAEVEVLAQRYTNKFYMSEINLQRLKQAAALAKDASVAELKTSLDKIISETPSNEIHEFYSSLFYIYLTSDDPNVSVDSIKSLKFLAVMRDVFKKGNSTNSNIIKTRELLNKWLENTSNIYRVTTREATKTGYRRAIYYYFILTVTSNK